MPNPDYALTTCPVTRKTIYAHHTILPRRAGLDVDHINGDKKDFRPENLRYLPRKHNAVRRFDPMAGIDFITRLGKWRVRLQKRHLGVFSTKEEALNTRAAALEAEMATWTKSTGLTSPAKEETSG